MANTFDNHDVTIEVPRDTFVVRIWTSNGSNAVRGHIEHVQSRKRTYFATSQRLLTFIREKLAEPQHA